MVSLQILDKFTLMKIFWKSKFYTLFHNGPCSYGSYLLYKIFTLSWFLTYMSSFSWA